MINSQLSFHALLILALLCLFSCTQGSPLKRSASQNTPRNGPGSLSGYSVPTSDGSTSLPSPSGTLKVIALGRGTQNYTCSAASNSSSTPTPLAIGAKADLLDASPLLEFLPPQAGMQILDLLPEYLVNFNTDLLAEYPIPLLGHHYFNAAGQPTFDLGPTGFLTAKKVGDIPAPSGACAGSNNQGFGAVDWLSLNDAGGSTGLSQVYRVVTAGGKAAPTCSGQSANIEVQYSALYWFYD